MANPRVGHNSILRSFPILRALPASITNFPVDSVRDGRIRTLWKPEFVSLPPGDAQIRIYPVNGQLLNNWYMRDFPDGAGAAPGLWTLVGAGASAARNAVENQIDDFCVALTRAGTDCYLAQGIPRPELYRGRQITVGVIMVAPDAATTRLTVETGGTGGGLTSGGFHSGGGGDEFTGAQNVTVSVPFDSSLIEVRLERITSDGTSFFDGAIAIVGAAVTRPPHAANVDYVGHAGHNMGTAGWDFTIQSTADPSSWAAPTTIHGPITPANDNVNWQDFAQASASAYRILYEATTGSQGLEQGVVHLGEFSQWPDPLRPGSFDPYGRRIDSILAGNRRGIPIGRQTFLAPVPLDLESLVVDEANFSSVSFQALLDALYDRGESVFLQWDDDNHGTQTFYAWVPEKSRFRAPLDFASGVGATRAPSISVPLEGISK